jgi:uncharacterized protein YraI
MLALVLALAGAPVLASSWIARDSNLRTGPGNDYRVRAVLQTCDMVDVVGRSRGWLHVESDRGLGWVRASNVSDRRPRGCRGHRPDVIIDPPWRPDPWHRPIRPHNPNPLDEWNRWHDW